MSKRILVIDDEEAIRKSFTLALESTGFVVETAESGDKGIARFQDQPHDMVFLDLKMPGLDGVSTLRALRSLSPDVPIYVVTAFHQAFLAELREVQADGMAFELLQKPVDGRRIRLVARSVLSGTAEPEESPPARG